MPRAASSGREMRSWPLCDPLIAAGITAAAPDVCCERPSGSLGVMCTLCPGAFHLLTTARQHTAFFERSGLLAAPGCLVPKASTAYKYIASSIATMACAAAGSALTGWLQACSTGVFCTCGARGLLSRCWLCGELRARRSPHLGRVAAQQRPQGRSLLVPCHVCLQAHVSTS